MCRIEYNFKYWNLLVYIKIREYQLIMDNFHSLFIGDKKITNILTIIRLVFFISTIAHIFGCCWQGLAQYIKFTVIIIN